MAQMAVVIATTVVQCYRQAAHATTSNSRRTRHAVLDGKASSEFSIQCASECLFWRGVANPSALVVSLLSRLPSPASPAPMSLGGEERAMGERYPGGICLSVTSHLSLHLCPDGAEAPPHVRGLQVDAIARLGLALADIAANPQHFIIAPELSAPPAAAGAPLWVALTAKGRAEALREAELKAHSTAPAEDRHGGGDIRLGYGTAGRGRGRSRGMHRGRGGCAGQRAASDRAWRQQPKAEDAGAGVVAARERPLRVNGTQQTKKPRPGLPERRVEFLLPLVHRNCIRQPPQIFHKRAQPGGHTVPLRACSHPIFQARHHRQSLSRTRAPPCTSPSYRRRCHAMISRRSLRALLGHVRQATRRRREMLTILFWTYPFPVQPRQAYSSSTTRWRSSISPIRRMRVLPCRGWRRLLSVARSSEQSCVPNASSCAQVLRHARRRVKNLVYFANKTMKDALLRQWRSAPDCAQRRLLGAVVNGHHDFHGQRHDACGD